MYASFYDTQGALFTPPPMQQALVPVTSSSHAGLPRIVSSSRSIFDLGSILSDGTNVQVINNGHAIQVGCEWKRAWR